MKSQISKLYKVTKPYTPTWEEIFALKPPLPETLVTVRTGNRKLDATMTKVLNRHPKFREAAERIYNREFRELQRQVDEVLYGKVKAKAK